MKISNPTIESLLEIIAAQAAQIARLEARIKELEQRLNKNSRNSSKPPSSDGFKKPQTTSLREKGRNKSGGQHGHKGSTLKQVAHPHHVINHPLLCCPDCGENLSFVPIQKMVVRQVFDIPKPQLEVTEHRSEIKACPHCKMKVSSGFPDGVDAPAQYGVRLKSMAVYLQHQHFIPEKRVQQVFKDLFDTQLATATLTQASNRAATQLIHFEGQVLARLKEAAVKHLDETGFRVKAKTYWLHVLSSATLTYYHIAGRRKSLIDGLLGTIVHDHWKPYFTIHGVKHGLCNQHHLRELKGLLEFEEEVWAKKMDRFLRFALKRRYFYQNKLPDKLLTSLSVMYERIIEEGLTYHEGLAPADDSLKKKPGRAKKRPGHNLLIRFRDYRESVLHFLYDPLVPFTNNQAEQDLRMMKCKQKISGGFRSIEGAREFARIRGFISTMRKQQQNIFDAIQGLLSDQTPSFA